MRYVGIGAGALVVVVLIVLVVGWMLPVKHRASRQAAFHAPPERVVALLTTVTDYPAWRRSVKRVETLPDAGDAHRFREIGDDGTILYEMRQLVPGQRVETRIADTTLPFGGRWTYEVSPSPTGTTLRITEDGEVYNPIFRFVSRFVMGHAKTIETYLRDVAAHLGERPAISA